MTTRERLKGDETELNMTPMIDVVFQLIVFFLLSLKFKTVDEQISSTLPKDRGLIPSHQVVDEIPTIRVKLFREDLETPERAWTRIRVGNRHTFALRGRDAEARRRVLEEVASAIHEHWALRRFDPDVQGEIRTPPPKGQAVPHGDVMAVLDAFLAADLTNVRFHGARPPEGP